jgi:DNA-binding NarL/FixJ family response regulator
LQALSLVWRSRAQFKSKRIGNAALSLAALLLEGGLSSLAAGPNGAEPGVLLLGIMEAANRNWPLYAGVRYEARAAWRRESTEEARPGLLPEETTEPHHEQRLDRRAALAKLTPTQQQLLALAAEGLTDQEIGMQVGRTAGAVRESLRRARARLEKIF